MAQLNFPDPSSTQTYTEAGITWTWNATLGVWSSEPGSADEALTEIQADSLYLSKKNDDTAAGEITFQQNIVVDGKVGVGIEAPERSLDVDGVVKLGSPDGTGIVILGRDEVTPENNWHIGATGGNFEIWSGVLGSGDSKFTVTDTEIYSREKFVAEEGIDVKGGNLEVWGAEGAALVNSSITSTTTPIYNYLSKLTGNATASEIHGYLASDTLGNNKGAATLATGFYGNLTADGTKNWNFYAAGNALNYFGGNVYVKTTTSFPGVDNTNEGLMIEAANDGVTIFGSRTGAASLQLNRNSAGDVIVFRRNGQKRGEIGITDTNITIGGLIGGPLLRNGNDLDTSVGLVNAVKNVVDRIDALEANEIIDDATDTSLLQLIASASARLDSIEARLTALENA